MDPTLAKGHKNDFFREVRAELNQVVQNHLRLTRSAIPTFRKRSQWDKYVGQCVKQLGDYLLHHRIVGSKRHPALCLYLFDEEAERAYNSWNEKCLGSCAFILSANPFDAVVRILGFNLSEHAVQRIFERQIADNVALTYTEKLHLIIGELQHVPLLCAFWSIVALLRLSREETAHFEVLVPTPHGLLLGEMSPSKMHLCELRTFVPCDQLFASQHQLRNDLLSLSARFGESAMAFYLLSVTKDIQIDQDLSGDMLTAGASVLQATGHADLIPR